MTPRLYRRRSSKESRARCCDAFDLIGSRPLIPTLRLLRATQQQQIFPPVTGCLAHGYPSGH